jgi:uncharacterized protein YciI
MKAIKKPAALLAEAQQLEQASRLTEAAAVYRQLVDADPLDQKAVARLLILYRRLKEPKKELAVIESALAAYAQRDKVSQVKWISAHPQAAKAGRAFLRSLGGPSVSAFGSNPIVDRLLKRKELVENKVHGKRKRKISPKAAAAAKKKQAAEERQKAIAERKQAAEERKRETQRKKAEAAAKPTKPAVVKATSATAPSLFVITISYLAAPEKIDAALPKHVAFLDKHFAAGDFLVAGRQVPRTGGIIIARGKDRASVERIMKRDPFLQRKLASIDIVEFTPGKMSQKLWPKTN